jgi:hypothetical protein
MDLINPHIIEWFIVPVFMYLLLFGCRDNLNILHMPLADFVALVVVADVALGVNFAEMPNLVAAFRKMHVTLIPVSRDTFWCLAVVGVVVCVWLIFNVENKIFSTVIHRISVGPPHKGGPGTYLPSRKAFRDPDWQSFLGRWAAGFGITAMFVSLHAIAVGIYPFASWLPYFAKGAGHWFIESALVGFASFLVWLLLATLLLFLGVFRYSNKPLSWTL